jgi:DNA repair protein RadC
MKNAKPRRDLTGAKRRGWAMVTHCPTPGHLQNGALKMVDLNSTPPPTRTRRTRHKVSDCVTAYGAGEGALSFRHGLKVRERNAIDKALAIVGRTLAQGRTAFDTPDAVKTYIQLQLAGEQAERFAVLFLDHQNRLISFHTMFIGTVTQTSVYPRQVVHLAIMQGASGVVLAHNHPSGSVQPSPADELLTQTFKVTLALIDVRVLDHIIVAPGEALSMAERGLM